MHEKTFTASARIQVASRRRRPCKILRRGDEQQQQSKLSWRRKMTKWGGCAKDGGGGAGRKKAKQTLIIFLPILSVKVFHVPSAQVHGAHLLALGSQRPLKWFVPVSTAKPTLTLPEKGGRIPCVFVRHHGVLLFRSRAGCEIISRCRISKDLCICILISRGLSARGLMNVVGPDRTSVKVKSNPGGLSAVI